MKPHIKKVNGLWWCDDQAGESPRKAFFRWQWRKEIDSIDPKEKYGLRHNLQEIYNRCRVNVLGA